MRMPRWFTLALLSAIVIIASAAASLAATYYASPTGTDAGVGTRENPWKIGYSYQPGKLDKLQTGDTLLLLPGTYAAPIALPVREGATGYVTIAAETPRTVDVATTVQAGCFTTTAAGANWVRIRGIDFRSHYIAIDQKGPIRHLEVIDCQVTGGLRGVKLDGPGADWTFRNVIHNQVPQGLILGVKGSTAIIDGVLVENCQSIDCDHPELTNTDGFVMEENVRNVVIRDCVSHGSEDTGFDIKASPLLMERCEAYGANGGFKIWGLNSTLRNCYGHDCGDYGITLANNNMRLEWCTFTRNVRCAIRAQGYDNQTHTYLGCVFNCPAGTPPLRNGYNNTTPKTSYCWWRAGSSPIDVLWGMQTLWLRYRDAAGYVSATDVIGTGDAPILQGAGDAIPDSVLKTMGPGGAPIGWQAPVPAGKIAIIPPTIQPVSMPRVGPVVLTFAHPVDQASAEAHFALTTTGSQPLAGTFTWVTPGKKLRFTPAAPLPANTSGRVTLSPGIVLKSRVTIQREDGLTFTTGNEPVVMSYSPTGQDVALTTGISLTFDQAMNKASVLRNLKVFPATAGKLTWKGNVALFKPSAVLAPNTVYTIVVGRRARTTAGIEMGRGMTWKFTTGVAAPSPASLVVTGTAASGPAGAQVTVNLSVAANVQVQIRNMAGRPIAALPEQSMPAGVSSMLWSGMSSTGTRVPRGQYLVQIIARTADGAQANHLTPLIR